MPGLENVCRNTRGRCSGIADEGSPGPLTAPNPKMASETLPGALALARFDTRSRRRLCPRHGEETPFGGGTDTICSQAILRR